MKTEDILFNIIVFGFVGGVFFRSLFDFGTPFFIFILFIALAVGTYGLIARQFEENGKAVRNIFFLSIFGIVFFLGMARVLLSESRGIDPVLEKVAGERVSIRGYVSEDPDERENTTRLIVDADYLQEGENRKDISGKILVIVSPYPEFRYGDLVTINGMLQKPKNFENEETSRQFDYVSYLAKDGVRYEMREPVLELVSSDGGNPVIRSLLYVRGLFLGNISRVIPEPEAALLGGLVVGVKQSLGKNLLDDFRRVGLIHTVVLSGYNITIVAEFMMRLFSFMPRLLGMGVGGLSIVLFALLTGASATVVRSSIMALLVIIARLTRRTYDMKRALFIAGFFMILHNPMILVFDVSFQLSFLATLGLIYFSPVLEKRLKRITEKFGIREIVSSTIATQLFVLPLLLYTVGLFSVVGVIVNIIVLPFIPWTMLFGFMAGIAGFLGEIVSLPFAFVAYALLSYELFVVRIFSNIPFAAFTIHISVVTMAIWYAAYWILFSMKVIPRPKEKEPYRASF